MTSSSKETEVVSSSKYALVVFSKTPGYAKPKTRLAKKIGGPKASEIHKYLVNFTKSFIADLPSNIDCFWSCAEKEAQFSEELEDVNVYWDPNVNLRDKVSSVINSLLLSHSKVIVIGTDCPLLSVEHLLSAYESLDSKKHCLGRTRDGGFYLLGSKMIISDPRWAEATWGKSNTAEQVIEVLGQKNISFLPQLSDIDLWQDLTDFMNLELKHSLLQLQNNFKQVVL